MASPRRLCPFPARLIGSLNTHKNKVIGGDFATNLWQRGTTISSITPTTATMIADRWFALSTGNTVTVTKQTGASDTIPTSGLYASMRVNRPSGSNVTPICVGQALDKTLAQAFLGQNASLSFRALAGAGMSSTANQVTVTLAYYTAADSTTPGTNTNTFALGTITGYQAVTAGTSPGTTATSVTAGAALIPIATSWGTYEVYGPIPSANASGTAVTGVGFTICYTPTGTGGATDWFEIEGVQLAAVPSGATAQMPNGVTGSPGFERRMPSEEAVLQLYYSYVLVDQAATIRYGMCQDYTTAIAHCWVQFTQQMRETPSVTVATTASFAVTNASGTAEACNTSIAGTASAVTPVGSDLTCTNSGTPLVAGNAAQMIGGNPAVQTNFITFSAEP